MSESMFNGPSPLSDAGDTGSTAQPTTVQKVDFDDLMDMYDDEPAATPEVKAEEPEGAKAAGKEQNLLNDAAQTVKKIEEKVNEEHKKTQEAEAAEKEAFEAKHGDEAIKVPYEAVITGKINGKDVPVKVADAVNAYLGQETFNRNANARMHQIAHKEQTFSQDVQKTQSFFKSISDAAAQGDFLSAMNVIAEMTKQDPVDFEKKQLEVLSKVLEAYTQMDEPQRDRYFAERKAEYFQKKLAERDEVQTRQQKSQEFVGAVEKIRSSYGLSEEQMGTFINEMLEEGVPKDKITPQSINQYLYTNMHYHRVWEGIKAVDEGLLQNDALFDQIAAMTFEEKDWTVEDISDVVRAIKSKPTSAVENLGRKVAKSPALRSQFGHVSSAKPVAEDDELESFFVKRR